MFFVASAVYRFRDVGLDPLQLVFLGTVLEASVLVFEVPTGVVADVYSRKTSVVIGYAIMGSGLALEGLIANFGTILVAQVVWGFGYTFISGASQAWVADELGDGTANLTLLRGARAGQVGGLLGTAAAVALGVWSARGTLVLAGAAMASISVAAAVLMREEFYRPTPPAKRESWAAMRRTLNGGIAVVRGQRVLRILFIVALIAGAASETADRLWPLHLDGLGAPDVDQVVWVGAIHIVATLGSIVAIRVAESRAGSPAGAAAVLYIVVGVGFIAFGGASSFLIAIVVFMPAWIARMTVLPLQLVWHNEYLEPESRATALSIFSQADSGGQIVGGPLLGLLAVITASGWALAVSGVVFVLVGARLLAFRRL